MSGYKRTINKFNRGEVDERFLGRDDVDRVVDTSAEMVNMLPIRLGPMQYRPGTQNLGVLQTAINYFLVPFLAANDASLLLEFFQTTANPSVEGFRVWQNGALVTCTATANTITNGSFTSNITSWTDGSGAPGTAVWDASFGGCAKLTGDGGTNYGRLSQSLTVTAAAERTMMITIEDGEVEVLLGTGGVDSGTIFSGVLARGVHALTFTPSATPVTITLRNSKAYAVKVGNVAYAAAGALVLSGSFFPDTSTTGAVIRTLQYAQSADVIFLTSDGYRLSSKAYPLVRVDHRATKSWSLTIPEFQDGPFGTIDTSSVTLTPSATTGDITLTASLPLFMDTTTWVGRSYKLVQAAVEGICVITSVTNSTTALARVVKTFGATTATGDWYPGQLSYYQPSPTAVALYASRLWLAGAGVYYGSVSDAYSSYDTGLAGDSKAISKTIGFGPVQQVNWLSEGSELLGGTAAMEFRIMSNDFGDPITATTAQAKRVSSIGACVIPPVRLGTATYIVQRSTKRIIEITNVTKEGGADERDLMLLHPDVCSAGIRRIGLARHPEPRIYAVLADGTVAICLIEPNEKVIGWSPVTMASATILDVCVLPNTDEDEVYVIVKRGSSYYMERFAAFSAAVGASTSRHYDSHVYNASPGTTISGLTHLNGYSVYVWADGKEVGPFTVAAGAITVPANSWVNTVTGVKHIGTYQTNRLGQYIPASVLTDRKRVTHMGLVAQNVALKTIMYGETAEYGLPVIDVDAGGAPSSNPNIATTYSATGSELTGTVSMVQSGDKLYTLAGRAAAAGLKLAARAGSGGASMVFGRSATMDPTIPLAAGHGTGSGSARWSPDGTYLAFCDPTSPYWAVYNMLPATPVLLADPASTVGTPPAYPRWSPNSRYLACALSGTPFFAVYDFSTGVMVKLANPSTLPTAAVGHVAWSYDSRYLAVSHGTSRFVTVYDLSSGALVKLADPATLPTGAGADVHWHPSSNYLAVAHTTTPFVSFYSVSGTTITKLSNPATLPAGNATLVAFDPTGTYVAVSHATLPFITYYAWNAGVPVKTANAATAARNQPNWFHWNPVSLRLAAATSGTGSYQVFNLTTGTPVDEPAHGTAGFGSTFLAWDSSGRYLASGGGGGIGQALFVEDWNTNTMLTFTGTPVASAYYDGSWQPSQSAGGTFSVFSLPGMTLDGSVTDSRLNAGGPMVYDYDRGYVLATITATNIIAILDVNTPTAPSVVSVSAAISTARGVTAALYVYYKILVASSTDTCLALIATRDTADIHVIDTVTDAAFSDVVALANMYDGYAFAACRGVNAIKAVGYDGVISTLTDATKFAGMVGMQQTSLFLVVVGKTNGWLTVVDASNPLTLTIVGSVQSAVLLNAAAFAISGDYVAVATTDGKVCMISIATLSAPVVLFTYTSTSIIGTTPTFVIQDGIYYISNPATGALTALDFRSDALTTYGEYPMEFDGVYDTDSRIRLQITGPATILALTYEVDDTDNPAPAGGGS